jgi:DNA adenine methylase
VPPIKCQGIKTKLVPLILSNIKNLSFKCWIEPFMGSGVVGLNVLNNNTFFSDLNPHVINFYLALKNNHITPSSVREFLEQEGKNLENNGEEHYYYIRNRFNQLASPLDFLFLSRACFNGMIRFNSKGGFNVPFCKKPNRFAKAYITKIVNQITYFQKVIKNNFWNFQCQDFEKAINQADPTDVIYCDPPYLGRHVDYFDSWSEEDETRLFLALSNTKAKFILSTWHSNQYRINESLKNLWKNFYMVTQQHFYHIGAKEINRVPMLEALVMNFTPNQTLNKSNSLQIPIPNLFSELLISSNM